MPKKSNLPKLEPDLIKVALVTAFSAFIAILDGTIVSVAQKAFVESFETTQDHVVWVMTGYTLALASVIPITGWAAEKIGTRNLYAIAMSTFVLGSALCALAPNLPMLITARCFQGIGGGMLMPLGTIIVTKAAGVERFGQVMAFIGIPMLMGPVLGPIIGGFLIDKFSWHWIFFINVPLGILALIFAMAVLPKDYTPHNESFDFRGLFLLSPGLVALLYGLTSVADVDNLLDRKVVIPIIVGIILIVLFVLNAKRTAHPLLEMKIFKNRQYIIAITTAILFMLAFFGSSIILPLYLMLVRNQTAMHTGLLLAPQGIGAMITMPIAGRLTDKYGAKKFVIPGLLLTGIGLLGLSTINLHSNFFTMCIFLFITGLGSGMTMMPAMSTALKTLTPQLVSKGSTLSSIINQVTSSTGVALMSVIWTRYLTDKNSFYMMSSDQFRNLIASTPEPKHSGMLQAQETILSNGADSMAKTFLVGILILALALIPASMLPNFSKKES